MKRLCCFSMAGLVFAFLLIAAPYPAAAREGYRIVNVVDDFMAYHRAAKDGSERQRAALWDSMVEAAHRAFFDDAVYRRKKGPERERYKAYCRRTFWEEIAPEMDFFRGLNRNIGATMDRVVLDFRKHLPEFKPDTDFYVTFSFSFRGKAVGVGGRDVLALGMESFRDFGSKAENQIRITLAHEMFHLFHFRFFSASGGLYRPLWAEGLATYASAVVVPGFRSSAYLGFSGTKMNRCHDLLPQLAADLKKNMGRNDRRLARLYFGAEANQTKVPPEAGYYVGLLIAERLARKHSLAQLAKMDRDTVFRLVAAELDRLAEP